MSQWSKNEKIVQLFQIGTSNRFSIKQYQLKATEVHKHFHYN